MKNEKVFAMSVAKVYPLLVAKAEKKGRTKEDVNRVTCWLTGYSGEQLEAQLAAGVTYEQFFAQAPAAVERAEKVTGSVCGIRVQEIEDPLMRRIRALDKLVDDIAKGKPLEKILKD